MMKNEIHSQQKEAIQSRVNQTCFAAENLPRLVQVKAELGARSQADYANVVPTKQIMITREENKVIEIRIFKIEGYPIAKPEIQGDKFIVS